MAKKIADFLRGRFLQHTAIYLVFSFFNKGTIFLLIPVFTRVLTPEEYGAYSLFLVGILICNPLMTLCVHDAAMLVYYHRKFPICDYVSTFVFFCCIMLCLHWVVLFFLIWKSALPVFLLAAPLVVFAQVLMVLLQYMWLVMECPLPFGVFNSAYIIGKFCLCILAVVFCRLGLVGIIGAELLAACFTVVAALCILKKNNWLGWRFDRRCLSFGLKLGLAYFPSVLAMNLNYSVGRFFLAGRFDLSEVGIYSIGERLGAVVGMYVDSLNNVYCPWLFRTLPAEGSGRKVLLSVLGSALSVVLVAFVSVAGVYVLRRLLLGTKFSGSLVFVFWSACAYVLNGIYNLISNLIYYTEKTWILSALTVLAVSLNVLVTGVLIDYAGVVGVVYGPIAAWGVTLMAAIAVIVRLKACIWRRDRNA